MMNHTAGASNVAIGDRAGYSNGTGTFNVFLGPLAGYYETGSSKLFIDNTNRASEADARTKALIYGVFDAAVANQFVQINGVLNLGANDVGLARSAAGVLKVTDGSTGYGSLITSQYKLSALNTAPASASDTCTLGEIRVTAGFIYICTATNTWVRAALATW